MTEDKRRAAGLMAELLYTDLEIDLRPSQIETFINRRWERIAPLAHRVHGGAERDQTKDEVNAAAPVEPTPMQRIRELIGRVGRENREAVLEDYRNMRRTADPYKAEQDLLDAIKEMMKGTSQ